MNGRTMGEPPGAGKPADAAMAAAVERYGRFWAELRPDTTRELLALARPELLFKDPFNEIGGVDRVVALLGHMFASATEVRFEILRHAWSGDTEFYRWDFGCRLNRPAVAARLVGVSEVRFDGAGRVETHIDHWDAAAQVYERVPVLGSLVRLARKRLAFPG
jgi:steroid Delta-isomerase